MPSMNVEIDLKRDQPRGVTEKVIKRAVNLSMMELKGNLQRNSPVDQGKMQGSWLISADYSGIGGKLVSSAAYTSYVNDGTGIYGPRGRKIVPRTKKALAFTYKGKNIVVPWVRGIRPRRFVEKSITQTEQRTDEFVIRAVMEYQGELE